MSQRLNGYAFIASAELHQQALSAITALRENLDDAERRDAFGEVAAALADCGLAYFLEQPMDLVKASGFHAKAARLGLSSTRGTIGGFIKRIVRGMRPEQLATICDFVEQLMVPVEPANLGQDG